MKKYSQRRGELPIHTRKFGIERIPIDINSYWRRLEKDKIWREFQKTEKRPSKSFEWWLGVCGLLVAGAGYLYYLTKLI